MHGGPRMLDGSFFIFPKMNREAPKRKEIVKFYRNHEFLSKHAGSIFEAQLQHMWETNTHKEEIKTTSR